MATKNSWVEKKLEELRVKTTNVEKKVYEALLPHFYMIGEPLLDIGCVTLENGSVAFPRIYCPTLKICVECQKYEGGEYATNQMNRVIKLRKNGYTVFTLSLKEQTNKGIRILANTTILQHITELVDAGIVKRK